MSSDSGSDDKLPVLPKRLATGQSLKHFQLESVLGEGGMGIVYRAHDSQLCRPVAVKVLPPELTAEPERKQRFLQEARAAARISHPSVAQIFYVDEQDGLTFIVMELVEGKTVRELIRGGSLDLLGVMDVAIQAAEGLAKAHELGIVHRDIKPANLMVTSDGHVKILDFGLAKLLDRTPAEAAQMAQTTLPGMVMGTAAYMSPEQIRGLPLDGRADIFSLGVLLFEMATGQSPFERPSFMDTLHAVAYEDTPTLASIRTHLPDELQRIVSRCLRKNAEERYPDAKLLARDLGALRRSTQAGLAPRTDWRRKAGEAWERLRQAHPSQYLGYAAAALAAASLLYFSLWRIGTGSALLLGIGGIMLARHLRNRAQRVQELFVRRTAKIPEVRLIKSHQREFTIVVDRPVAQLYSRINQQLRICNRKLYFGQPMTVAILHELPPEKLRQLLAEPGVQYVREDVLKKS